MSAEASPLTRALIPPPGPTLTTSSNLNPLLKAPPITLRVWASTYEVWGHNHSAPTVRRDIAGWGTARAKSLRQVF